MDDPVRYFITWTTYGSWLPGDTRGWRKTGSGEQQPRPLLEDWCKGKMKGDAILLSVQQRQKVEDICNRHATIRNWRIDAISARSNHVHVAIEANADGITVRNQLKANATSALRGKPIPVLGEKIWTRGGDIEIIESDEDYDTVVRYIVEAQDRMERGK